MATFPAGALPPETIADLAHSYTLITTPRSGSTLLCDLLTRTGLLGRPTEHLKADLAARLARDDLSLSGHMAGLRVAEATLNGVFGTKVIVDDLFVFLGPFRYEMLTALRRGPVYVLIRGDKAAQAFSCVRSDVTGAYHATTAEEAARAARTPFDPDPETVLTKERWLLRQEADLFDVLADAGIKPIVLSYEAIAQDRRSAAAVIEQIAAGCNVTGPLPFSWPDLVRLGAGAHVAELARYREFRAGVALFSARSQPGLDVVLREGWDVPARWGVRTNAARATLDLGAAGDTPVAFELLLDVYGMEPLLLGINGGRLSIPGRTSHFTQIRVGGWAQQQDVRDVVAIDLLGDLSASGGTIPPTIALEEVVTFSDPPGTWWEIPSGGGAALLEGTG